MKYQPTNTSNYTIRYISNEEDLQRKLSWNEKSVNISGASQIQQVINTNQCSQEQPAQ